MTELRAETRRQIGEAKLNAARARQLTTWLFYFALCEFDQRRRETRKP